MHIHRYERRGIIKQFGTWTVTHYGIENLTGPCQYEIDKAALAYPWWSDHMVEKNWVNRADFDRALRFARRHFRVKVGGSVLW